MTCVVPDVSNLHTIYALLCDDPSTDVNVAEDDGVQRSNGAQYTDTLLKKLLIKYKIIYLRRKHLTGTSMAPPTTEIPPKKLKTVKPTANNEVIQNDVPTVQGSTELRCYFRPIDIPCNSELLVLPYLGAVR